MEISDDRERMCDTYEDWLVQFMKMKTGLEADGAVVSPIRIKLDGLKEFCMKNKLKNTGEARSRYALFLSNEMGQIDKALRLNRDNNPFTFN